MTTNSGGRPASGGIGSSRPATVRNLATPNRRGRPRASGHLRCDRCNSGVPRIRVRWPDGAICGPCFTDATHTYGVCAECAVSRMLPGRSPTGEAICRDCAGITTKLECARCGHEAERYRGGLCARCALSDDLHATLQPRDDRRLLRLIEALATAARPESILSYMRGAKAQELLSRIGRREVELTHAAFDSLPRSTAKEHLRALLTHHGALPERGNEPVARFKKWLAERLASLPNDGTRSSIEQFATWRHLRRIRETERDSAGRNFETITHAAKQEITEAGKFLRWLRDVHSIGVNEIQQAHVDEYLSSGTTTRRHVRNYLHWLDPARSHKSRRLDAPYRLANSTPMVTQEQRLEMVRNCLDFEQVVPSTRIAGLIFLLWAQPLNRIVMLKQKDIGRRIDGLYIHFGPVPTKVPTELAEMFSAYLHRPSNQQTGNTGTEWIFPGIRAGQHLHERTLSERLKVLGIDPQRARNATLQDLTRHVDARTLIDILGYSGKVITLHAARAGAPMADYIDLRRRDAGPSQPSAPAQSVLGRPDSELDVSVP